jgi:hypothetical protein
MIDLQKKFDLIRIELLNKFSPERLVFEHDKLLDEYVFSIDKKTLRRKDFAEWNIKILEELRAEGIMNVTFTSYNLKSNNQAGVNEYLTSLKFVNMSWSEANILIPFHINSNTDLTFNTSKYNKASNLFTTAMNKSKIKSITSLPEAA